MAATRALHILFSRCPWRLLRIHLHGCRNLCTGKQATTTHIFKCNRWQQPRLHILFLLPMETAENSPARLPQSVHWKASNNYAYLQVQQMAATAPPHSLFPLPMETAENSPATVAAICALECKQQLCIISSSATDGSNRAFTFSSRCPWRLLRIHLHGCRNLCTGKQATTMHIFKCDRWQQPRLHILFPLPMETAENSPARLPQSVHWKASKNYAHLQVQQMAATAPPHALPVAHGDC